MKKLLLTALMVVGVFLASCTGAKEQEKDSIEKKNNKGIQAKVEKNHKESVDYGDVKPNEAGKVMIVMFHNFVQEFRVRNGDDGAYTTTFSNFEKLLPSLYQKGYRLVSIEDYLNNNIDVPLGCIPIIFTFDDATPGQFNLVKRDEKLALNEQSAVGIIKKFNEKNPGFGMKGTFYVNLGLGTFEGEGTLTERLKYLTNMGFDIGNHTYTHINLSNVRSLQKIIQEVGSNHKKMQECLPGYKLKTFSLPYGAPSNNLKQNIIKGEYDGEKYENNAIVEVGWDPALSPIDKRFDPFSLHRVRASGIKSVETDLDWWLTKLSKNEQYVSDGDKDVITVPLSKKSMTDETKLKGKRMVVY